VVRFTAAETRFLPRLIEKDYFCTLPLEPTMTTLVRRKLAVPGNEPLDVSPERLTALRQQLDTELRTVLREKDFREFDLERAFRIVKDVAAIIG
jgi:hypothetical protein